MGLLAAFGLAPDARAQEPFLPDVNDIALNWSLGSYVSPLFCEIDGEVIRGVRRLNVMPGSPNALKPVNKIVFVKLDVDDATRCFTELAPRVPNYVGQVQIRVPGKSRPETAASEFRNLLKRKGGVEFEVPSGRLFSTEIGADATAEPRRYDLRGARARLQVVKRGTDAARVLADLPRERQLVLEIDLRDGEQLRFPMAYDRPLEPGR